jgi:hypothetical protein
MSSRSHPARARAVAAALAIAALLAGPSIAAASVFWLAHDRPPAGFIVH